MTRPCEHLWKSNQKNIFILLNSLLKSTPCWLTSAQLHHWGHTNIQYLLVWHQLKRWKKGSWYNIDLCPKFSQIDVNNHYNQIKWKFWNYILQVFDTWINNTFIFHIYKIILGIPKMILYYRKVAKQYNVNFHSLLFVTLWFKYILFQFIPYWKSFSFSKICQLLQISEKFIWTK